MLLCNLYQERDLKKLGGIITEMLRENVFEEYYKTFYPQIYGYVYKKLCNVSDAEDLTMDIFVSCYQKFDTFDSKKASFSTWIYVIANNKLKNYYRDKKTTEDLDENIVCDNCFENEILTAQYLDLMRSELATALKTLPEIQRKIVIRKFFKNENSNEISLALGISSVNVRVQLTRALNKLNLYFQEKNIDLEI